MLSLFYKVATYDFLVVFSKAFLLHFRIMQDDELKSIFSKNLRKYRKLSGMTQAELAYQAETSPRHYQRMEGAEMIPNVILAYKIAKALQVTLDSLFEEQLQENDLKSLPNH
jgi:DNA-binding XRE family transcriptional regulator